MTKEQIQEGNEIITEYTNLQLWSESHDEGKDYWWSEKREDRYTKQSWNGMNPPQYNDDYNWLIPVVKKVLAEIIGSGITDNNLSVAVYNIQKAISALDIDKMFQETVNGIQLLNKIKEQNNEESTK